MQFFDLEFGTEEEIFEQYQTDINDAKLHEISYDLQMDCLLFSENDSDGSDTIKNLDIINGAIVNSISKYGEMLEAHEDIKRLYSDYQKIFKNIEVLNQFQVERRSISIKIRSVMVRINELTQVYKNCIEFALNDVKRLAGIVADPDIAWGNAQIEHKIELLKMFTDRLISSTDLLIDCDTLQRIAFNALSKMRNIFNELKGVDTFEPFLKNFKELLDSQQGKEVRANNFRLKLNLLSNKIENSVDLFNKYKDFNKIKGLNSYENVINHWKYKAATEKFVPPKQSQSKKRKYKEISVSCNSF